MNERYTLLVSLIVLGGALGARLHHLSYKCLWLDEALSVRLASFPLPELVSRTGEAHTCHPPLYFMFLRLWVRLFGDSEFTLRLPSVLFGVIAVLATMRLVRDFAAWCEFTAKQTSDASLFVGVMVGLSPLQLFASREVRGYAMGAAFCVLASICLLNALRTNRFLSWAGFVVSATALCYTHYFGVIVIASQVLYSACFILRRNLGDSTFPRRCAIGRLSVATIAIAIAYLPWMPIMLRQASAMASQPYATNYLNACRSIVPDMLTRTGVESPISPEASRDMTTIVVCVLMIGAVCIAGIKAAFLITSATVPLLVALGFSLVSTRNIIMVRYVTFSQISLLAAVAFIVALVPGRFCRWLVMLVIVACTLPSGPTREAIFGGGGPGLRKCIEYTKTRSTGASIIIAKTPFVLFGASYYAKGQCNIKLLALQPSRGKMACAAHIRNTEIVLPAELTNSPSREIWLISSRSYDFTRCIRLELPSVWRLESVAFFKQDYWFESSIVLEHYRRTEPSAPRIASPMR